MRYKRFPVFLLPIALALSSAPGVGGELRAVYRGSSVWTFGRGELRRFGRVPFLWLMGTPREIGLQYGVLLREELRQAYARLRAHLGRMSGALPWYLRPFGGLLARSGLHDLAERLPAAYYEELRGLAEGAGLDYEEVLLGACGPEVLGMGCSTILMRAGGRPLLGRNLDYFPAWLGSLPAVVHLAPPGKRRVSMIGFVGYLGVLTGMNDRGVALALNAVPSGARTGGDTPIGYKLREILETAGGLDEVERHLTDYAPEQGWAVSVCSAADDAGAIYDLAGADRAKTELGPATAIYVTNVFRDEGFRRRHMGLLEAASPTVQARTDRLRELAHPDPDGVDGLLRVLADDGCYGRQGVRSALALVLNHGHTLQTVVLDPGEGAVYFSSAPGFAGFARVLRHEAGTGETMLYRGEDPRRPGNEAYTSWAGMALERYYARDYRGLAVLLELMPERTGLDQAFLAYAAWRADPAVVDVEILLSALTGLIESHADFAHLYRMKAELLLSLGRDVEAAALLERLLVLPGADEASLMAAHTCLAEMSRNQGSQAAAEEHARAGLALLRAYAVGPEEEQYIKRLLRCLPPEERACPAWPVEWP